MVYGIYPRCYEAEPSNPEGIPYTTASEESMWLVPQLTAFHQSQAEKSIPLGNTFRFRQLRGQRLEKCGLCNRKNTRGRGLWGKTEVTARVRSTSGEPRVVPHKPRSRVVLSDSASQHLGYIPYTTASLGSIYHIHTYIRSLTSMCDTTPNENA